MKRTYNIVGSGAKADFAKGEIEFLIYVTDIDHGRNMLDVLIPIDTPDIETAERILTTQVTNSFASRGILTEDGEISDIVGSLLAQIKKEHPRFIVDPVASAMMKIGGNIICTQSDLPDSSKVRFLFRIGPDDRIAPFAGVDVYVTDPRSISGAMETLRAQVAAFAPTVGLTEDEASSISEFLSAKFRSLLR